MPVLTEKTKIRTEKAYESRTTSDWAVKAPSSADHGVFYGGGDPLETNIHSWVSGSTRVLAVPYLSGPSLKAREILKKVLHYKFLVANWDGNNAVPPLYETVDKAFAFVSAADDYDLPFYFTAPGPNGEIIIEFKQGTKTAEVYFNEDHTTEMILYNGQEQTCLDDISLSILDKHLR